MQLLVHDDGDGLNALASKALAAKLLDEIASGRTELYARAHRIPPTMVNDVSEFAAFLDGCGGFEIC